jgi:hypothetical protein
MLGFAPRYIPTFLRSASFSAKTKTFMLKGRQKSPKVIPAKAGIHASYWRWIPAFAGMT